MFAIALFIASKYFFVGVGLAIWMAMSIIAWPVLKGLKFILLSSALTSVRWRAVSVTAFGAAALIAVFTVVPIPNGIVVRGIVWLPEELRIVAQSFRKFR